uniref:BTB domain-containing protein n=1 Tax=Emiliania huxleyi TaxID=2903 RepID=A0A7S3TPP1_EMIHU
MEAGDEHLTAHELRARIEEQRALRATLINDRATADNEVAEARERQRLRRELEKERYANAAVRGEVLSLRGQRRTIDNDLAENMPGAPRPTEQKRPPSSSALAKSTVTYASNVAKHEFVWEVQGLSWLEQQLTQEGRECTNSNIFQVDPTDGYSTYMLVFSPRGGSLEHEADDDYQVFDSIPRGTLALIRRADDYGTNLCYRFFVRDASLEFQPLGEATRVAVPAREGDEPACFVGGPLHSDSKGLFGLSFDELLGSEWVKDDSICFKVCIEEAVMKEHPSGGQIRVGKTDVVYEHKPPSVEVPPPTLQADFLSLLTEGRHSDVTIEAAFGEAAPVAFSAHTIILSQRSDVFAAAFSHEMRESATRTLTVTDVPPPALKALLHFLYTDDFDEVLKVLREEATHAAGTDAGDAASSSAGSSSAAPISCAPEDAQQSIAQLQAVLAAAHKYGVLRLLRWAEGQLCDKLSCEMACSLLSLAHVYGATELERNCLAFMKANMPNGASGHSRRLCGARARVPRQVPCQARRVCDAPARGPRQVQHALRGHRDMHCAGVDPAEEEPGRKRKRDDE